MIFDFFSKGRNIVFCWIACLGWGTFLFLFSLYPKIREYSDNADLPEETLGFTSEVFYGFLEKIGEAGRGAYLNFQFLDYLNAVLLGTALFGALYYFINKLDNPGNIGLVLVLPILSTVFDILENTTIIYLISGFPVRSGAIVEYASFFTNSKLGIGSIAFLSVAITGIVMIMDLVIKKYRAKGG